ncbi:MAG: hypothetical protein GX221_10970 [Candidatus Riflebacteria bacterium]|nr:hypothetical protein [Candidatus Riflebacteria bacterium]
MAAGKSYFSQEAAKKYNLSAFDIDDFTESKAGISINEIFKISGEPAFRKLEHQAFSEILKKARLSKTHFIIAAGGGLLTYEPNIALLEGLTPIFIDTPFDIIKERLKAGREQRPLAPDEENELKKHWQTRRKNYIKYSKYIVACEKDFYNLIESLIGVTK